MTLVMGIIGTSALLFLMWVGLVDGVESIKLGRWCRRRTAWLSVRALDPQKQVRLIELVEQGSKIQAIKDIGAATGLRRKDLKDAVDALAAGHDVSGVLLPGRDVTGTTGERAAELIAQGRRIEAIVLIREGMGLGLKEAMNVADGLGGFTATIA